MTHNQTTLALYKALTDLGAAVYSAGLEVDVRVAMNSAREVLLASEETVNKLRPRHPTLTPHQVIDQEADKAGKTHLKNANKIIKRIQK